MDDDRHGRLPAHRPGPRRENGVRSDVSGGGYYWCVQLPGGRAAHGYCETSNEAEAIIADYQQAAAREFRSRRPRSLWVIDETPTEGAPNGP